MEVRDVAYDVEMDEMRRSNPSLSLLRPAFALLIAVSCCASGAKADDVTTGDEVGVTGSYLLPHKINGMTEIMPAVGLHYGLGTTFGGMIDFDGTVAHAWGSDYYNLSGGVRGVSPLFPGAHALYFGGLDITAYRASTSGSNKTKPGFHFGGGIMMKLVGSLSFRADARMINGPGTILAMNLGLVYKL